MNKDTSMANILIVDDTPANLRLLAGILTDAGYLVRPARDGKTAIMSALSSPPDLILLDIIMPQMNGYEVCTRLKTERKTSDIPVIFISALDNIEDKINSFTAGGVDYITKPFQAEEVLARVKTHLTIRKLQTDLLEQIAELNAFGHTVAHDLKTPLGLVVGFAEHLTASFSAIPPEEQLESLNIIKDASHKAATIVDELLLLSSVRKEKVPQTPIEMSEIVSEAQKRLNHMIEQHCAEVLTPDNWMNALGHGPWLEEVWTNYISNAIKYGGEPPQIKLGSTKLAEGRVKFWVQDNGRGLTQEEQNTLFAEFTRLNEVRVDGHGLGLSIVHRIMQKLGGEAGVESELNKGSRFYFVLPAAE